MGLLHRPNLLLISSSPEDFVKEVSFKILKRFAVVNYDAKCTVVESWKPEFVFLSGLKFDMVIYLPAPCLY